MQVERSATKPALLLTTHQLLQRPTIVHLEVQSGCMGVVFAHLSTVFVEEGNVGGGGKTLSGGFTTTVAATRATQSVT